jgi:RecB family endonuclease NucS
LRGGAELYESEIEDLVWSNPEEVVGDSLFVVQRQPNLLRGGRPDIVALDRDARVVVIEVKRGFDRSQLAQCLELRRLGTNDEPG